MASALRTVYRNWFGTAPAPVVVRTSSARWGRSTQRRSHDRRTLRVAEVIQETPSTKTFVLEPLALDRELLVYEAGQHLTVLLEIDGVPHRRCYSFSTSPLSGERPAITVKRVAGGVVSGRLHDHLEAGQTLRVARPSGSFTVRTEPAAARQYAFVAGGVGITPLVSLAETVLRSEPKSRCVLLFGNRSEDEIIFRRRLANLSAEFPRQLSVRLALDEAPTGWGGIAGGLSGARVVEALGRPDADLYYVCGPEPMMEDVIDSLRNAGVDPHRIQLERFTYPAPAIAVSPSEPRQIHFAASGKRATAKPGQTLLEAAQDAGVDLPFSCTMGGCAACKVRIQSGSVLAREPNCLSEQERGEGYVLTCCSYADQDVVIEGY